MIVSQRAWMPKTNNRRRFNRYELELPVSFAVHRSPHGFFSGEGSTINISSSGMMLRTDVRLFPGDSLSLAARWPFSRSAADSTHLVVAGSVVWGTASCAALAISRHQLITRGEMKNVALALRNGIEIDKSTRRPIMAHLVIVDDDLETKNIFSDLLRPEGFLVEITDAADTRRMVARGFPPVCLVVTSSIGLWSELSGDVPAILTVEEGQTPPYLLSPVVLRKPFTSEMVRIAVRSLAEEAPMQQANSA
jgi:hypothetical protein